MSLLAGGQSLGVDNTLMDVGSRELDDPAGGELLACNSQLRCASTLQQRFSVQLGVRPAISMTY